MAFLTMEDSSFGGGTEEARFPPCFSCNYAGSSVRCTLSLNVPERP